MLIKTYLQAENYLLAHVPKGEKKRFPAELGLKRTRILMELLGNPQNKLKVIHVAGTSGKGSTCYLISIILTSLGFKVGLHLSPHLLDLRERVQISSELISKEKFVDYLNLIIPAVEKVKSADFGSPTFFEIVVALTFYIFYKEKVDYAVIETGMGGLFDGTNTVDNPKKMAVITKIGLDHTNILGKTIKSIARQKSGIIHKDNLVISTLQRKEAQKVIMDTVKREGAKLFHPPGGFNGKLGMLGEYQKENAALALEAVKRLSIRDRFKLDDYKILKSMQTAHFPGRFDVIKYDGKTIILDGAHNPQKMSSFIKSLKKMYPGEKFDFLIAFKSDKDYQGMLKHIVKVADRIVITKFSIMQDMAIKSGDPKNICVALNKLGFKNYLIEKNYQKAFIKSLNLSGRKLVVTGSLYLLSKIYPLTA